MNNKMIGQKRDKKKEKQKMKITGTSAFYLAIWILVAKVLNQFWRKMFENNNENISFYIAEKYAVTKYQFHSASFLFFLSSLLS